MTAQADPASGRGRGAAARELLIVLQAVPEAASIVRHHLAAWLEELDWPAAEHDDLVLAVSEAVANCTDHAYHGTAPGPVHVHGWQTPRHDGRRVVLAVTDRGRWRKPNPQRGYRGHGLPVMHACVETVHIDRAPAGTTVVMASRTVPNSPATGGPVSA